MATPGMADAPAGVLHRIESAILALSAVVILGMALLIAVNIVLRNTVGLAVPDIEVMIREAMIAATILPLAYTTAVGGHISVDILYDRLPPGAQRLLDRLAAVVGLFMAGVILWAGWRALWKVIEEGSYFFGYLSLPEWPGRLLFVLGYGLMVARLLVRLGRGA